jgi:CBS domain-containing protein
MDTLEERLLDQPVVAVRDVMTPAVHHVSASARIAEAARVMVDHHIHRLVVTEGREPVGIITSMDLLRVIAES